MGEKRVSIVSWIKDVVLVLQSGVICSAVVLAVLWLAENYWPKEHILGWTMFHIVPVGALVAGVLAAIGYLIALYYTRLRVTKVLVAAVILLQLGVYVGAEYVQFRQMDLVYVDTLKPVGFWAYFDIQSRSYTEERTVYRGDQLPGLSGWFARIIEMLGFAAGGIVVAVPMVGGLRCAKCGDACRTKEFAKWFFAPGVPIEEWRQSLADSAAAGDEVDGSVEAYFEAQAEAFVQRLREALNNGDEQAVLTAISDLDARSKEARASHCFVQRTLSHCPGCCSGKMAWMVRWDQGVALRMEFLKSTPLSPQIVEVLLHGKPAVA